MPEDLAIHLDPKPSTNLATQNLPAQQSSTQEQIHEPMDMEMGPIAPGMSLHQGLVIKDPGLSFQNPGNLLSCFEMTTNWTRREKGKKMKRQLSPDPIIS